MTDFSKRYDAFLDRVLVRFREFNPFAVFIVATAATIVFLNAADGWILEPMITWRSQVFTDTTHMRIGSVLLSGLAGFSLGWLVAGKHSGIRSSIVGIAFGFVLFLVIFDHGELGWGVSTFAAVFAFGGGLAYWIKGRASQLVQDFKDRISETPSTLGSSTIADYAHCVHGKVIDGSGILLGEMTTPDGEIVKVTYDGGRHIVTTAPTRAQKGVSAIIPNLLTYEGSVIVTDPKGENAMVTVKHRKELMGQAAYVYDPWGITGFDSACINPMDWLKKGDVDIGENALLLADAIIMSMGENEQFWTEEAKALLLAVILLVAIDDFYEGYRNLGTVRDLLCADGQALTDLFKRMTQCPHPIVRSAGMRSIQKEEKLLSNVLASVQAQTHFLDSQRVRLSLASSDFNFEDVKTKPTSIYLVLPSDRLNAYGRLLRLLIQQAITVNARNIEKKPKKPVLFILDEMPALGKLTMIETAFGLMAGYGLQLWGICQDASQLKRIYSDGWETFISNAGVLQYFGSRDKMTAEYFSSLCGVTTVWNWSTALARAVGITRSKENSTSDTTTMTDTASGTQRRLIYADELMRMRKDKQLLLIENLNPIIADKKPWFDHPELKDLGVNLYADEAEQSDANEMSDDVNDNVSDH